MKPIRERIVPMATDETRADDLRIRGEIKRLADTVARPTIAKTLTDNVNKAVVASDSANGYAATTARPT